MTVFVNFRKIIATLDRYHITRVTSHSTELQVNISC